MSFVIKQGDTSPSLRATLKDAELNAIDLTGAVVIFHMKSVGGELKVSTQASILDQANGLVQYIWTPSDTNTVGTYYIEFEVTYADGSVETFPNKGYQVVSIVKALN